MPAIRRTVHRRYWSGCVVGSVILLTAHILEHSLEDGFGQTVIHECTNFVHHTKGAYPSIVFDILLAVDANCSLPANHEGVTGECVLPGAKSHTVAMANMMLAWFEALNLRALNTFASHSASAPAREELWTCGTRRVLQNRSQIDFLAVTPRISGTARPESFPSRLFRASDHRPLLAELRGFAPLERTETPKRSLKGWAPASAADEESFQRKCVALSGLSLGEFHTSVHKLVSTTPFTTTSSRQLSSRRSLNALVKQARAEVASASPSEYRSAVQCLRRVLRRRRKPRSGARLESVRRVPPRHCLPMQMEVGGELTHDRSAWLREAELFGKHRFQDPANDPEVQEHRLAVLSGISRNCILDGNIPSRMSFYDVLQGRAKMKANTAPKTNGCPPEVFKALPFFVCIHVWRLFLDRQKHIDSEDPPEWKHIDYAGIPKEPRAVRYDKYRWISSLDCFWKWYVSSLIHCIRPMLPVPRHVCNYGFKAGLNCIDIVCVLRQVLFLAHRWNLPAFVAALDVATAFDSIDHGVMGDLLARAGVHAEHACCLLREVSGISASLSVPTAGSTSRFSWTRGGKQGGKETPDVWNVLVETAMEDLVRSWSSRHFGFDFGDDQRLTHLVWADNIFLVAASADQLSTMCQELTNLISAVKLSWKESSLQYMRGGPGADETGDIDLSISGGATMTIKFVDNMEVLGVLLDHRGSSTCSFEHRQQKGEACFWAHSADFVGLGTAEDKFRAWCSGPSASIAYGSSSWHVTSSMLLAAKRWEYKFLRRALRLRRRASEGCMDYNQRTARIIESWACRFKCRLLHHRILHGIFRQAWREEHQSYPAGQNHVRSSHLFRNREWWAGTQQVPWRSRRDLGLMHSAPGHEAEWEDVLVMVYGAHWRAFRDQFGNVREWMANFEFFANQVCARWQLPLLPCRPCVDVAAAPGDKRRQPRGHVLDDIPGSHAQSGMDVAMPWGTTPRRVLFVVDCQPLQRIVCGHAPCLDPSASQLVRRTCDNIVKLMSSGWSPPDLWADPVAWRRREYNVIADHLANYTMDVQKTWSVDFDWPYPTKSLRECSLIVHSDGGARGRSCAASAWVVEVLSDRGDARPLAMGGTFHSTWIDSFWSEAAALAECSTFVRELVGRCGV